MHKNNNRKTKSTLKKKLTQKAIKVFDINPEKSYNYKSMSKELGLASGNERKLMNSILLDLEANDWIKHIGNGKYSSNNTSSNSNEELTGIIDFNSRGAGYLIVEGLENDIYIHATNTGKALQKDKVRVSVSERKGKQEGIVIEVLERSRTEFVGTIDISPRAVFVRPDDKNMPVDFFIDRKHLNGAKDGEKVKVKLLSWPGRTKSPLGAVVDRLGMPGTMDVEMNSILAEFGFPYEFPKAVTKASEEIEEADYDVEVKDRRDFRDVLTFTIDPVDAKDFDDALSYKELENGNIEIGVHIADVSHYVKPNSILDKEAYSRGNSVYLVDRVIPMLPEVLSNKLCSLRPNETKLTFSAVFEINREGEVQNEWFGKTIIYSDKRFAYEDAQEIIEGNVVDKTYGPIVLEMDRIAKILRGKRLETGALNVESQEVRFQLDEDGNPLGIILKVSKDANKLIEEYMLLANRRVAAFVGEPAKNKTVLPLIYRVHDEPNPEKIADLKIFLKEFGYEIKDVKNKPVSYALNQVMVKAKLADELHIIGPMVIRSMSKAIYTTENIGHYGLAFKYYAHFTSPIRRYADLLVHRILQAKLTNTKFVSNGLEDMAKHISATEKEATSAERASTKYMQVKFMSDKIGEIFDGKITGVTDWGIFVEMEDNKCEGLVHIRNIEDGSFFYHQNSKQLLSNQSKNKFHLGQKVSVLVKHVDLIKKQIDLELS